MRKRLIQYVKEHSFLQSEEAVFLLASGKRSRVYFDLRLTTLSPEGQYLIGNLLYEEIQALGIKPRAVGGLTMGADPVYLKGDPMEAFIVRKEPKAHGRGLQIEGNIRKGDDVVIVDDVLTTGGSTIKALNIARETGLNVLAAIVVLDRQEQQGRENVERHCPLHSILTMDDFKDE
jgi:orotate phosphoribosyltransferase